MPQIAVRVSEDELAELDAAVAAGVAATRADAVRMGIDLVRRARREAELADEYVRVYADRPLDEDGWLDAAAAEAGRSA